MNKFILVHALYKDGSTASKVINIERIITVNEDNGNHARIFINYGSFSESHLVNESVDEIYQMLCQ